MKAGIIGGGLIWFGIIYLAFQLTGCTMTNSIDWITAGQRTDVIVQKHSFQEMKTGVDYANGVGRAVKAVESPQEGPRQEAWFK